MSAETTNMGMLGTDHLMRNSGNLYPRLGIFGFTFKLVPAIFCVLALFFSQYDCCADDGASDSDLRKIQEVLATLHGWGGRITWVPLKDIKWILEHPPEIKDGIWWKSVQISQTDVGKVGSRRIIYDHTNYWRVAAGVNGYFEYYGPALSDLANITTFRQGMQGAFGSIAWKGTDAGDKKTWPDAGGILMSDGRSTNEAFFGKDLRPGDVKYPLALGIAPLGIGTVQFRDDTHFIAANWMDGKTNLNGRIIVDDSGSASGVEYEIDDPRCVGWKYIVTFFEPEEGVKNNAIASDVLFPIHQWATYSIGSARSNLMERGFVSYMQLTSSHMSVDFFNPSNLIKRAPILRGLVISNELYTSIGTNTNYVLSASIKPLLGPDRRHRIIALTILLVTAVGFLFILVRAKLTSKARS